MSDNYLVTRDVIVREYHIVKATTAKRATLELRDKCEGSHIKSADEIIEYKKDTYNAVKLTDDDLAKDPIYKKHIIMCEKVSEFPQDVERKRRKNRKEPLTSKRTASKMSDDCLISLLES